LGIVIAVSVRSYEGALFGLALGFILCGWLVYAGSRTIRTEENGFQRFLPTLRSVILPSAAVLVVSAAAFGYYNYRVTGSPLTIPYTLSQHMYGVPRGLYFQARVPEPPGLTQDQHGLYVWQNDANRSTRNKIWSFRRFYLGRFLIWALCFLILAWRNPAVYQLGFVCLFVTGGAALYWFYVPHYTAPITAAVVALVVLGLRELWNLKLVPPILRRTAVIALLLADLVVTVQAGIENELGSGSDRQIKFTKDRDRIEQQLRRAGGRHLVFVRTSPDHFFDTEWVYNRAKIDDSEIVWARPIDPADDARLVQYFSGRSVWVIDVDKDPIELYKWRP
jgi:hypothetical protein